MVLLSDNAVTYTGSITDSSSGVGTYLVSLNIPTSQTLGTYFYKITFRGTFIDQILTAQISACSN